MKIKSKRINNALYIHRSGGTLATIRNYLASDKRLRARRSDPDVVRIMDEFRTACAGRQFTNGWFDQHIPSWLSIFADCGLARERPLDILEIGSFEGRSSLFLLRQFPQARLTAVDTWQGSDEHSVEQKTSLGDRFAANVAEHRARIEQRVGSSLTMLPQLDSEGRRYDLIYVDGSHLADDVLRDAISAWRLLKSGGVMIFDDYLWSYYEQPDDNPCRVINAFLDLKGAALELISVGWQVAVRKR